MPKNKSNSFFDNKVAVIVTAVCLLLVVFIAAFAITTKLVKKSSEPESFESESNKSDYSQNAEDSQVFADTTELTTVETTAETTTKTEENTTVRTTAAPTTSAGNIAFPSDTGSWQMICLNKTHRVDSDVENRLSLSYVAGSSERMDSRAASAYEKMYSAAASDGIYLTPCSGYRSYSTQKRLYNEFVNDYLSDGYGQSEAESLASKRRMPPGSSEHNIGICMDIITASSSDNFQNTKSYAWLSENAAEYGFILRYPQDKVDVTGVKFEPWHWRYVGVDNAYSIKSSGLCLEEYLGIS